MSIRRLTVLVLACAVLVAGCGETAVEEPNPFQCLGMATPLCERLLDEARTQVPGSAPVSADIRCTEVICDERQGNATIKVRFANGQTVDYTSGWASSDGGPAPAPPQPVPAPTAEALPSG